MFADHTAVGAWLAAQAAGQGDPSLRMAALARLANYLPAMLPPDIVSTAVDLLSAVYATGTPPAQRAGSSTDPPTGAISERRPSQATGRPVPEAAELVRNLSFMLGERIDDRVHLLTQLLRSSKCEARHDTLYPAKVLIDGWRGAYQELVFLIGEQLADPQPQLRARAARTLEYLDELAAPAADALARALDTAERQAPDDDHEDGLAWILTSTRYPARPGPTLRALAALRDVRALPALRWALELPGMPAGIGILIGGFGAAVADLVPLIQQRLRDLPTVEGWDQRRSALADALGGIGAAAAVAVPQLVPLLPEMPVLTALGKIGPGASDVAPALRRLLDDGEPRTQIAAAEALWRIGGDAEPVLPLLLRHLDGRDSLTVRAAAQALAEIGPAAAVAAPKLRELIHAADPLAWLPMHGAKALWRLTGDVSATLPVLCAAWSQNRHTRTQVAGCLAEMGPAAGTTAPLLRAELHLRRRPGKPGYAWSPDEVSVDLALLRECEHALAAVSG